MRSFGSRATGAGRLSVLVALGASVAFAGPLHAQSAGPSAGQPAAGEPGSSSAAGASSTAGTTASRSDSTAPEGAAEQRPATPASGGPADEAARQAEARRWFAEGRAAYEQGDFARAVEAFEQAFRLASSRARVLLLVNLGQAHDRLGHRDQAIHYFERNLELMPDGPKAEFVASRLAVLRREKAEAEKAAIAAAPGEGARQRPVREDVCWVARAVASVHRLCFVCRLPVLYS